MQRLEELPNFQVATVELSPYGLPFEIEEEYVSGPLLGACLRHIMHAYVNYDAALAWVFSGKNIKAQAEREDWKTLGYNSRSAWQDAVKPGGMSRSTSTDLINFWTFTFPRIVEAGYDGLEGRPGLDALVGRLERSAIREMVGLLNLPGIDKRAIEVVCSWVMSGQLVTVEQFRDLKNSPAMRFAVEFMDVIAAGGLDPVETYDSLAMPGTLVAKLGPMAQFATTGEVTGSLSCWVDNMRELAVDRVVDTCASPHGKAHGSESPRAVALERSIEAEVASMQGADRDSHTELQFQMSKELPDGYREYRVVLTPAGARALWSKAGAQFFDTAGNLQTFRTNTGEF